MQPLSRKSEKKSIIRNCSYSFQFKLFFPDLFFTLDFLINLLYDEKSILTTNSYKRRSAMKLLKKKILNSLTAYFLGIACPKCSSHNIELINFFTAVPPAKSLHSKRIELEQIGICQSRDGIYLCHGCGKQFTSSSCL